MKYFGYVLILAAFIAGYKPFHPAVVLVLGVLSVLTYMSARRTQVRDVNYTGDRNMIVDGAFMLIVQTLIMFTVYILGWFLANKVSLG